MVSGPGPVPVLAGDNAHAATPAGGTYIRERDGKPASLLDEADYPVRAVCKVCGGRIRLGMLLQWDWAHAPARVPS
jgi:hypothetical protein